MAQVWQLKHEYTLDLLDGVKYAQCPDSLLTVFRPQKEVTLEEVRNQSKLFLPKPKKLNLKKGDVVWLKGSLINKENTNDTFLMGVDAYAFHWSLIDIYLIDNDSVDSYIRTGNAILPKDKIIRDARNFFRLTLEPGESKEFFRA